MNQLPNFLKPGTDTDRDGMIVCKDGFAATTVTPEQFLSLARGLGREAEIETVDGSCVFCEVTV